MFSYSLRLALIPEETKESDIFSNIKGLTVDIIIGFVDCWGGGVMSRKEGGMDRKPLAGRHATIMT